MVGEKPKTEEKAELKTENKMKRIKIEKVVLSVGGVAEELEKGVKLLERLTGRKSTKRKSRKRIPSLGVRPGLEIGALVTLRGADAIKMLKKLFAAIDNQIREKQISNNSFSFGIKEYIEIPGVEYQRDIGIIGFDVSVSFARAGKRVIRKKIKKGRLPKKQQVPKEEIADYLKKNLGVEVI
ncbi:MAG: 50S ribosomal protein L5 [Candidatus Thorarchaeota archaeon]|jgi:large subunit ribosomal protein L5